MLILLWACAVSAQNTTSELSTEAQRAYLGGDLAGAREKFELLLRIEPTNRVAINYLRMIRAREQQAGGGGGEMTRQLQSLVLPKVEFREATLPEAIEALRQQASAISEGKIAPNFILHLPPDFARKTITLNLTSVPFLEALRYFGQLTGTTFTVEKHAVVVKPAGASAPL